MIPAGLEPYLLLAFAAVIPTAVWRASAVLIARRIHENSPVFDWVRFVATALLAGVVVKLIFSPTGALAAVPLFGRLGGVAAALATFFFAGRREILAIVVGEAVLIGSYFLVN
jgi:hypothetical protein